MDTIFIREFRVDAWVGIYEWEKQRPQTLEMEIEIGIPGNEVGRTDNIHDTVNYGEVVSRVVAELAERRFKLLEALAEHVCGIVTGEFCAAVFWGLALSLTTLVPDADINARALGVDLAILSS